MAVPNKAAVVEAMRNDLGVQRVDDLKLENGRRGQAVRPEAIHQQAIDMSALKPPRVPHNPIANKWRAAIAGGEFDDDDAEAVKGLDRIGGGRLHALNNTQRPPLNHPPGLSRANGNGSGFGGGKPPNQFRNPASPGPPARMSVQNMAVSPTIPTGPRRVASSIESRTMTHSGLARASSTKNDVYQRERTQNQAKRILAINSDVNLPMPQTPPRGNRPRNAAVLDHFEVSQQPPPVFYDPEPNPSECFHKAYIYVADRLAKGNGIVYLLTTSPTDTGEFCIYLEGSHYLDYSVLDMINYIANSRELCPQFREADGVSITTTSMVFQHQREIAEFMTKVRTLQARRPTTLSATTPNTAMNATMPQTPTRRPSPSPTIVFSGVKSVDISPGSSSSVKQTIAEQPTPPIKKETKHHGQKATKPDERVTAKTPLASGNTSQKPTVEVGASSDLEGSLVDLSQPPQSLPSTRPIFSHLSSYAMDLGSLDTPMSSYTPQQEPAVGSGGMDTFSRELHEALPMIQRAGQMLVFMGEEEKENVVKSALNTLEETSRGREFLHALNSLLKKTEDGEGREAKALPQGPKYSAKELMSLRSNAKSPPQWLSKTCFLPPRGAPPPAKNRARSGQLQGTKENAGVAERSTRTAVGDGSSAKALVSVNPAPIVKPSPGGMKGLNSSRWAVGSDLDGKHS